MRLNEFIANAGEVRAKGKYLQVGFESCFRTPELNRLDLPKSKWEDLFDLFANSPIETFRLELKKLIANDGSTSKLETQSNSKKKSAKTEQDSGDGDSAGA